MMGLWGSAALISCLWVNLGAVEPINFTFLFYFRDLQVTLIAVFNTT